MDRGSGSAEGSATRSLPNSCGNSTAPAKASGHPRAVHARRLSKQAPAPRRSRAAGGGGGGGRGGGGSMAGQVGRRELPPEGPGAGRRRWQQQPPPVQHAAAAAPPSSPCPAEHPPERWQRPAMEPRGEASGAGVLQQRRRRRRRRVGCWRPPRRLPRRLLAAGLTCCTVLALYAASGLQGLPARRPREEEEAPLSVLLWWEPFGRRRPLGDCRARYNISGCSLSTNRSRLQGAHAVLFHHRDLVLHGPQRLPAARTPAQRWVWMNFESPSHSPGLRGLAGLFNWTMTYRVDSDVFVPYGYLRARGSPAPVALPAKTKLAAWVISNWNEEHARVRYYRQLKRYLPVDVYGARGLELEDGSVVKTVSGYKFYLAFENSQHPDYITEKLWRNAFRSRAVPVVLGPPRANYELFIPSDSFIHVDDFASPAQLAVYLKFLDKNKNRYRRYFAWRKRYDVRVPSFWDEHCCRVCEAIRAAGDQRKTVQNLANWFES
uniref:alpha-(1,3)-fucosyltransferase 4 n=1 Tax=Euleptes europaea TaxID=460621 RepID=UPI00254155AB|nr:alpha-(1,3)-fucosyltransferase 4 [Euleptes europaea]